MNYYYFWGYYVLAGKGERPRCDLPVAWNFLISVDFLHECRQFAVIMPCPLLTLLQRKFIINNVRISIIKKEVCLIGLDLSLVFDFLSVLQFFIEETCN